jgi:hypothetical protein
VTALILACIADSRECAVLLCSYGPSRRATNKFGRNAAFFARQNNLPLARWLEQTRHWSSPLHYLEAGLTPERTLALLAAGAYPHARVPNAPIEPSPLERARTLERAGEAAPGSPAHLVLRWWRDLLLREVMFAHAVWYWCVLLYVSQVRRSSVHFRE